MPVRLAHGLIASASSYLSILMIGRRDPAHWHTGISTSCHFIGPFFMIRVQRLVRASKQTPMPLCRSKPNKHKISPPSISLLDAGEYSHSRPWTSSIQLNQLRFPMAFAASFPPSPPNDLSKRLVKKVCGLGIPLKQVLFFILRSKSFLHLVE